MTPRIDTSHIRSPRDPMTAEEREAIREEIREGSEAIARLMAEHGDFRDDLRELLGSPWDWEDDEDAA